MCQYHCSSNGTSGPGVSSDHHHEEHGNDDVGTEQASPPFSSDFLGSFCCSSEYQHGSSYPVAFVHREGSCPSCSWHVPFPMADVAAAQYVFWKCVREDNHGSTFPQGGCVAHKDRVYPCGG